MKGYLQAITDNGLPINDSLIVEGVNDDKANVAAIKNLLQEQKPDGIFAAVERFAIAAYQACFDLSLSIPNDVKIISFSNLETAAYLNPSLTTITQPAFEIGKEAAAILIKALTKKGFQLTNSKLVLPSRLFQRESTARA